MRRKEKMRNGKRQAVTEKKKRKKERRNWDEK
jgi:hypothetical protein